MSAIGDEPLAAASPRPQGTPPAWLLAAWGPVAVWMAFILFLSSDRFSDMATAGWLSRIMGAFAVPPAVIEAGNLIVRKCAHFVEYAVLSILTMRAASATWPRRPSWELVAFAALGATAYAIVDELHQHLATATRGGAPRDVAIDMAGAFCGAAVAALFRSRRRRGAA